MKLILDKSFLRVFFTISLITAVVSMTGCGGTVAHKKSEKKVIDLSNYDYVELHCEMEDVENILSLEGRDVNGHTGGYQQGGLIGYLISVAVLNAIDHYGNESIKDKRFEQQKELLQMLEGSSDIDPCKKTLSVISDAIKLPIESRSKGGNGLYLTVVYKYFLSGNGQTLHGHTKMRISDYDSSEKGNNYLYKTDYMVESIKVDVDTVAEALDVWMDNYGVKMKYGIESIIDETNNILVYDLQKIKNSSDDKQPIQKKSCYESREIKAGNSKQIVRFHNGKKIVI